jgi:UDP-N-acetylmuramate--alanine ligase
MDTNIGPVCLPAGGHKHYFLIGIGGIGMSGIAHLLLKKGIKVSGSDLKENKSISQLKSLGAEIFLGHDSGNIAGCDVVVYSSAIKSDNPEFAAAVKANLPVIKRAQALAKLMEDKIVITVTGSHGKTTTTSLAAYLLLEAGLSPTMAIGGILKNIGQNASEGKSKYFVAEADESDGSFLYYHPEYSIITNIDYEHMDYYQSFEKVLAAYREFINQTAPRGCLFCCSDDENLMDLVKGYKGKLVRFGLKEKAQIRAGNIKIDGLSSDFDVFRENKFLARFHLALGGEHNISNALSVIALGLELGIPLQVISKALAGYKGAGRRLEIKFQNKDFTVIDDYAHHPTEIRATLAALRHTHHSRIVAVFQPHRYSRTQLLLEEFGKCFAQADVVVLTDIYSASEPAIPGVTAELVLEKIKLNFPDKTVKYASKEQIPALVLGILSPGDSLIMLGAGDIIKVSDVVVEELKKTR